MMGNANAEIIRRYLGTHWAAQTTSSQLTGRGAAEPIFAGATLKAYTVTIVSN